MKILKNKKTGGIYTWTEKLAQQEDMEEYTETSPEVVTPEPAIEEVAEPDIKDMARTVLLKKQPKQNTTE